MTRYSSMTLASLNLIFICIIVVLARRHWNLRRKLNNKARLVQILLCNCPHKALSPDTIFPPFPATFRTHWLETCTPHVLTRGQMKGKRAMLT